MLRDVAMGGATGAVGTAALKPSMPDVSLPLVSIEVGLAAMAMSDVPSTTLGATDPTTWSASDWAFDAGCHLIYGLATVIACDAFGES